MQTQKPKLFHIKANGPHRRNFIPLLQTDNGQFTTQSGKLLELHKHFSSSIGNARMRSSSLNWNLLDIPKLYLSSPDETFLEEEIKSTMFNLPSRVPGPDNFSTNFFKRCWEVIKHDVSADVNKFFNLRGNHWHQLNSAHTCMYSASKS